MSVSFNRMFTTMYMYNIISECPIKTLFLSRTTNVLTQDKNAVLLLARVFYVLMFLGVLAVGRLLALGSIQPSTLNWISSSWIPSSYLIIPNLPSSSSG